MIYLICKPIYFYKVHSCSLRSKTRIPNICHTPGILQLLAPWILTKPCKEIGLFFVCLFVFSLNEEREARRMKQIALDHTGKERDWDRWQAEVGYSLVTWALALHQIPNLPLLATTPWPSHLSSLCLGFLTCNVGMRQYANEWWSNYL